MSNIERVNQEAMSIAKQAIDDFPWDNRAAYAGWLAQTYYYSCHTVSLLSLMVARTDIRNDRSMHMSRMTHSNEEVGHDEWVRDDLKALGYQLKDIPELPETRMLWEPQFFKCDRLGTESVYGYTIVLEQLSVERGEKLAGRVAELAGGSKCNRFLNGHSSADVEHVRQDFCKILAFPDSVQKDLSENMMQTAVAYAGMLRAIA